MVYLVVGCTDCGRPRVIEGEPQTVECPSCGKRTARSGWHTWGRFDDIAGARTAMGRVNAHRAGEPGAVERFATLREDLRPRTTDPVARAVAAVRQVRPAGRRPLALAEALTRELGTWDEDAFVRGLAGFGMGPEQAVAALERLVDEAVVRQPRPGTFASV